MPELIERKIPAHTLTWLTLTGAVYDLVQNACVFVGDLEVCYGFDFTNDKYLTIEL